MTMIVVEDPTTITSEIQTRQLVETTMITLLLSVGQQIIINLLSDLEKLFQKQFLGLYVLFDIFLREGASPSSFYCVDHWKRKLCINRKSSGKLKITLESLWSPHLKAIS